MWWVVTARKEVSVSTRARCVERKVVVFVWFAGGAAMLWRNGLEGVSEILE